MHFINKVSIGDKYDTNLGGTQLWGDIYLNGKSLGGYSLVEVKTGKKWIDRKDIYHKTYEISTTSVDVVKRINIDDLNFDTVTFFYGFTKSNRFPHVPINFYNDGRFNFAHVNNNLSTLVKEIVYKSGFDVEYVYLIIEYTKK